MKVDWKVDWRDDWKVGCSAPATDKMMVEQTVRHSAALKAFVLEQNSVAKWDPKTDEL